MNAGLVREGIATDDRFVWLHVKADDAREQLARRIKLGCVDAGGKRQAIGTYMQRHHDLFQRRISRAFADAVNRAFDLPGPV